MSKRRVRDRESKPLVMLGAIILIVMLFLSIGLMRANVKPQVWRPPLPPTPQPESEETSLTDQLYNTLIKPITDVLGITSEEDTGSEPVGLDVQVGYTGTSGESIVYSENVLSGVGLLTHSGIFVKPSLGKYRALKLYDAQRGIEGEIWVKPVIRIRVFNGTPEEWSFHLETKVVADEDIIDIKTLDKSGKGVPPKRIEFERVSVKGSVLHKILRGEVRSLGKLKAVPLQVPTGSREICFYADYQGMMKFKDDPDPVVKELKNVKLACFDFEFKETGDFEMMTEQNVTLRPLAEVMVGGGSGMEGMSPTVKTVKVTVSVPYTTYLTRYLTTKLTEKIWTHRIVTKYRVYTLTKTRTLWLTKTLTKTYTYTQSGTTKTIIYTKTSTIPVTYTYTTTSTIPITYTKTYTSTIPITYTYTSTVTSTYTKGGTTYTTTYTFPVTTTYTSTKTIVSTSVSYRYHTITKTKTVWKKTTIIKKVPTTITKKVPGKPTTVTKTVTVTKYVEGGGGGGGSVLGNVTVITPDGSKPIQDVKPGDLVLTEEGFREVKEVKVIEVFNLYTIELEDGKVLIADDAQPVITSKGKKRVGELRVGDVLVTLDGTSKIIDIKRYELKATVYDLVFDEPLNYYADGVLVNDYKGWTGVILLTWPWSEFLFISRSGVW